MGYDLEVTAVIVLCLLLNLPDLARKLIKKTFEKAVTLLIAVTRT
jgi:hypothetical protein